jgi:hypothetical protein
MDLHGRCSPVRVSIKQIYRSVLPADGEKIDQIGRQQRRLDLMLLNTPVNLYVAEK